MSTLARGVGNCLRWAAIGVLVVLATTVSAIKWVLELYLERINYFVAIVIGYVIGECRLPCAMACCAMLCCYIFLLALPMRSVVGVMEV